MLLNFIRYLRSKLPSDEVLGPWIRDIRGHVYDQDDRPTGADPSNRGRNRDDLDKRQPRAKVFPTLRRPKKRDDDTQPGL